MKKFSGFWIRSRGKFYLRLLQILGFASAGFLVSCVKYGAPEPMYGVVENTIHFSGKVQSADSLKNIPGLRIRLVPESKWDSVTTTTAADGSYSVYLYAEEGETLQLKVMDKDSSMNVGDFQDQTLDLEISSRDFNNLEKETNVLLNKK